MAKIIAGDERESEFRLNPTTLRNPVTLSQVAVPLQVCYIVPAAATAEMITEIFNECYSRWGGRDTLIIPMEDDGTVDDRYWSWAKSLDPDIIYSYVDFKITMLERVDRELMPSTLIIHREIEGFGRPMEPRHDLVVRGLSALSFLPMLGNMDRIGPPGRFSLISSFMGWPTDLFVTDTFGINPRGPGWFESELVRKHVDIIALGNRKMADHGENNDYEISDPTTLLREIAGGSVQLAISMAQLSGMGYENVTGQRSSAWGDFNIIVGDTVTDRIAFWNSRVGREDYQRKNIVAVRVDEEKLSDTEFITALARFISRWNTSTSQSGPSFATVRSSSVPAERLQPILDGLFPVNVHARIELFTSVNDCAPVAAEGTMRMVRGGIEDRYSESAAALPKIEPRHLTKAGPVSNWFLTGGWTVQVTIKQENGRSLGSSIARVRIPRRWQAVRSIAETAIAKATLDGDVRIFSSTDRAPEVLSFTDDDAEFVANLFRPYHYLTTIDPRNAIPQPPPIRPQTSSAGRHLRGLLNKLGDIRTAVLITESELWKSIFRDMAVPREIFSDSKRADLAAKLKKSLKRDGLTILSTDEHFESLAETIAQIVPSLKAPLSKRSYEWFLGMYRLTEEAQRKRNPALGHEDIERELNQEIEFEVRQRCAEGVLVQGYDWTCPRCLHLNWSTIEMLKPDLMCEVCNRTERVAARFSWDFLLDDYVALGFRERGLRGLVWALGSLCWSARDSFIFSPPLALLRNGEEIGDADIACIIDGKFVIGEVKESDRKINSTLADKLIKNARQIRPDAVVLACYDPNSIVAVNKQAERVREELKVLGISVKAMVPVDKEYGLSAMLRYRGMWRHNA